VAIGVVDTVRPRTVLGNGYGITRPCKDLESYERTALGSILSALG